MVARGKGVGVGRLGEGEGETQTFSSYGEYLTGIGRRSVGNTVTDTVTVLRGDRWPPRLW